VRPQSLGTVVRRLRHVVAPPAPAPGTDAELVRAFAVRRDPAAFEQIVRRHGPMVLGVCRRILRDSPDADDAFQATFVVLVRKARSLRQPERLAGWLHQVANRTARKLRAIRLARQRREGELFDMPAGEAPADVVWRELRPIFDEELDRLPDKLRLPAVLCFLEGQSKGEAARNLGWPEGTLAGRLQRARERLRVRFAARGLTLTTGALAVALFEGVGAAAVPASLIATTIPLATAGVTGAPVAMALADGVVQAMFVTKVKAVAAAVLVAGVVGTGTGVVLVPGPGPGQLAAGQPAKDAPPKEPGPRDVKRDDPKQVQKEIDEAREKLVLADLQLKNATQKIQNQNELLRALLQSRLNALRVELEQNAGETDKRLLPAAQARMDDLREEMAKTEAELKKLGGGTIAERERALLMAEIETLKDRLSFEERMVKKGFMTQEQPRKTKLELDRLELQLAKRDTPKAPDPRRAILEDTVRALERSLALAEEGFKKGVTPETEVLNARVALNAAKLKLLELDERPAGTSPTSPPAADRRETLKTVIAEKERELYRAEALLESKAISLEEVRRLRIELSCLKADAADAAGDYAALVRHSEAVVAELRHAIQTAKSLHGQRAISRDEVRKLEVTLAEAQVAALKAAIRGQLASIVTLREQQLTDAKSLYAAKALSLEEVRKAEAAVDDAKARLLGAR
jgi:RNA polymerase sigma factor (sigma-70 family)